MYTHDVLIHLQHVERYNVAGESPNLFVGICLIPLQRNGRRHTLTHINTPCCEHARSQSKRAITCCVLLWSAVAVEITEMISCLSF